MLNGQWPIVIFNFKKLIPGLAALASSGNQPLLAADLEKIPLLPIPLYLSEKFTGLYLDSEEKNVDIKTDTDTKPDGKTPDYTQYGLANIVTINLLANKNSLGLNILLALVDLLFEKVTSKEYSVTYVHGAIAIFNGVLEGFSVTQDSNTDLMKVQIKLSRAGGGTIAETATKAIDKASDTILLNGTAVPVPGVA